RCAALSLSFLLGCRCVDAVDRVPTPLVQHAPPPLADLPVKPRDRKYPPVLVVQVKSLTSPFWGSDIEPGEGLAHWQPSSPPVHDRTVMPASAKRNFAAFRWIVADHFSNIFPNRSASSSFFCPRSA